MKFFLTTLALLASTALAQTEPSASAKANADIGQTECEVENSDGDMVTEICDFYQECHTSANKTKSGCISKGNIVCDLYSKFGTDGTVINNNILIEENGKPLGGCKPYQTCCDLECCDPDQVCLENLSDGEISYDGSDLQSLEHISRNGWKTKKGVAVANKPRFCAASKYKMDATTGFKAVYMPLCGLAVTAVIFIMAIMKNQESLLELIWPLAVIVTSFFLVLTEGWKMALMCTFVAAATMAAGDQDKKWLVWFQLFFMWVYFGGQSNFMFDVAPTNFFNQASTKTVDALAGECATYFNYYTLHTKQIEWYMDSDDQFTGICGRGFIGYQIFIAYGQAFALFIMTTFTVLSYLNPGSAENDETKNPAAGNVEMGAQ